MTREEAIRRLEEGAPVSELYDEACENTLIMGIESLKSAPVVRCKDCKCLGFPGYCVDFMTQDENGFCS